MYIDPGREKVWTLGYQGLLHGYTIDVQEVCNHSTGEDPLGIQSLVLLEQRAIYQLRCIWATADLLEILQIFK